MGFFGLRVFPVTMIGILLLTPILQRKSPYMIKEISLCLGISGGILYGDHWNSEHFWDKYG